MNEIKMFSNEEFGTIRTVNINNEVWFVASDICKALRLTNPTMAVSRLDEDERTKFKLGVHDSDGTNCINEYGLYNLVLASKKKEAKVFKRWITHEVLPSIRQNGGYINNQENLTPEQIVANALIVAQNIIKEKDKQITEMQPKVELAEAMLTSKNAISVGDFAKSTYSKFGLGTVNMFRVLRDTGFLLENNTPYQKYINAGYFRVIEVPVTIGYQKYLMPKTLITPKGQEYLFKKLSEVLLRY